MRHLVAELTRPLVLSDRALRNLSRLKQLHREELQRSGREPTRAELAERSGLDPAQVDDLVATEAGPLTGRARPGRGRRVRRVRRPARGPDGQSGLRVRQRERRALAKLGAAM